MKSEVLKRAMFAMPLSKAARNSGIMEGFEEEELESMEEQSADDMPVMARTPQNPEILMNTLRGDMRSTEARYMELAQMVGEEAAMETPPEVLAMLQIQLGQQQGGIGSLPQAAGMMPPGMMPPGGAPMPPQGGMPPEAGGMPPEGGMPPFSQGGAEAPPTPDGLPPMRAAAGAFVAPVTRFAQIMAERAAPMTTALGNLGTSANVAAGRFLSQGFPQTFRPVFENVRGPGGRFTAEQTVSYPTLTQHLANLAGPRVTNAVQAFTPGSAAVGGAGLGGFGLSGLLREGASQEELERAQLLKAYEQMYYQDRDRSIPMPILSNRSNQQLIEDLQAMGGANLPAAPAEAAPSATPSAAPEAAPGRGDLTSFIEQSLKAQEARDERALPQAFGEAVARPKPLTKGERIKKEYEELSPLYKELLGEDKETAKTNALLLLAEAGFKLAGSRQPTLGMAIAEAAAGLPRGFAAIAAQAQEQEGRIKAAALSQAINTIADQDKYAQAVMLEEIKERGRVRVELIKRLGADKVVSENVGLGIRINKDKDTGSYINTTVDVNDPALRATIGTPENPNRWTLKDTDNPFVVNRGPSPVAQATTPEEFQKIRSNLNTINNTLSAIEAAESEIQELYGPGAFVVDKYNKFIVPLSLGTLPTGVKTEKASAVMQRVASLLTKDLASVNNDGRVAVQTEKWARDIADGYIAPTDFFGNSERAAAGIAAQKTSLLNARMSLLNQAGLVRDEYVMSVPSLGTPNDPFVIPSDPSQQQIMYNWLRGTVGNIRAPEAGVYIRKPDGKVIKVSPADLRGQ